MRDFVALIRALDQTTSLNRKVAALEHYFHNADPASAAWCIYILSGQKIKGAVKTKELRTWCLEKADIPPWLFEDSYAIVGDLAETIATLVCKQEKSTGFAISLAEFIETHLSTFRGISELERRDLVLSYWSQLNREECFVFNKIMTGSFRVGASVKLLYKALARSADVDEAMMAHRLSGHWLPTPENYQALLAPTADQQVHVSRPYPFYLAYQLDGEVADLGEPDAWQVEWKWDGIRGQLIKRDGEVFLWSRGEELINVQFPEIIDAAHRFLADGSVIDGEILAYADNRPMLFSSLQQRLGRKRVTKDLLKNVPCVFMMYDLLEINGDDLRARPLVERRAKLDEVASKLADKDVFRLSPPVRFDNWDALANQKAEARTVGAEGFMLKYKEGLYKTGRKRGEWWKWKLDPLTLDLVLLYAQAGHGRRSNLYTDYTFGIWKDRQLVPLAKAYSGLTDVEISEVDRWIKGHTIERFGPVRKVPAELVFEVGFEGIAPSGRHKSGLALRFPRILRWRRDKLPSDADNLDTARDLIH